MGGYARGPFIVMEGVGNCPVTQVIFFSSPRPPRLQSGGHIVLWAAPRVLGLREKLTLTFWDKSRRLAAADSLMSSHAGHSHIAI